MRITKIGIPPGGDTNQVLVKSSGTDYDVEWGTGSGTATPPGGLNTQVQFNDGGVFGGDSGFTYNKTTNRLTLGSLVLNDVVDPGVDTDKFLVLTSLGVVSYRNGSSVLVDIGGVPTSRTLTINGTSYDLSANRTWSVGTVTSVGITAGTGISVANSPVTGSGSITVTNSAPDQTVSLTQGGTTTITGTYPNFTISSADQYVGTVTSVGLSAPTGFSVANSPVISSGTLALSFASGYSLPTTASQTNWDAAYNDKINSASVTGTTTKTLTLNQQDGGTVTASWTDLNTDAVTSVFGRTGAVTAQSGDYTTAQVTESGNLYYTDSRARLAISETITGIDYNNSTGVFSLTTGYVIPTTTQETNWNEAYTNRITSLTTTGSSGAATLVSNTLNIPNYTLAGLGGVPTGRTITINGTAQDLSADRTYSVGTVTSIATSAPITGGTITGSGTIGITQSSGSADGYLSSTDWTTFNNKFTLPSFTSGSVLFSNGTTIAQDNANFFWDDSNNRLGIGTAVPGGKLEVTGDRTYLRGTTEDYTLGIGRGGYTGNFFLGATASNAPDLLFSNNAGTRIMTVTNGGNLGLGTASPAAIISGTETTLNVKGSVANAVGSIVARSFGTTNTTSIGIAAYDTLNVTAVYTESNSPMAFYTNATERMRIFSTGNVFIGSSPSDAGYKLDVNGTGRFSGALTAGSDVNLESNESYINLFSSYVVGLNARARIRAVGAGGGSGYGGDFRVSTRATNNIWNDDVFVLNSSGAATFSSSVTANGFYANAGNSARFYRGANDYYWRIHSDSSNYLTFGAYLANGTDYLTNPKIVLQDDGKVKFNAYTSSSSFTGTAAGYLAFDSSGNILTTGNPASGSVTGSGTTDYIPKWTSSSALGNSGITDNGTNVTLNSRSLVVNTSGQSATISTFYQSGKTGNNIWIGGGGTSSGGSFTDAGSNNTSLGVNALYSITDGQANIGIGYRALYTTTTGTNNVSIGNASLESNTTGYFNCSIGTSSLFHNTTGYQNVAIGLQSGYLTNSGGSNQTSYDSVYIGYDSRASASGNNNEIVIGKASRGNGSNTTTIGNSSITSTYLQGQLQLPSYTTATSYSGTSVGFLGYTSAGNVVSLGYTETTWTPAFTNSGATIVYATNGQIGYYVRNGAQVTLTFRLALAAGTSMTGNALTITGLPFTSANVTNQEFICAIAWTSSVTSFVNVQARIGASTNVITLLKTTAASANSTTAMVGSDIGTGSVISGTITYFV